MSMSSESFASLPDGSHASVALLNRGRRGDESAFTEIFERHRQLIYRVCFRYVRHHHDAEDITQETFRRAALAMPSVDAQRPLEPWLVTIAANRCRSFLSRQQHNRRFNSLNEVTAACGTETDCARRLSLSEQLNHALDQLPAEQRRAFELIHQKELSYPEAARLMGRPLGTVKTWVRRAKRGMQDTLLAADTTDVPVAFGSPLADGSASIIQATETATTSGKRDPSHPLASARASARTRATAAVATFVAFACFGIARHQQPGGDSHPSNAFIGSIDSASALVTGENAAGQLDVQNEPSATDWQWVSLDAFLHTRLSIENVHSLPLGRWMQGTSPALSHLRSGIRPLESTLHRVAELFQCELAQVVPLPSSVMNLPSIEAPGEAPNVDEAAHSGDFNRTSAMIPLSQCSIG